jgi:hypothetical protein
VKEWLREKRHEEEYHKSRLELCEWAILIFLITSVAIEIATLFKQH